MSDWKKSHSVTIQMKPLCQYFLVALFVFQHFKKGRNYCWILILANFGSEVPCARRFLCCMAFSVYEVARVACLSRSWFVYVV